MWKNNAILKCVNATTNKVYGFLFCKKFVFSKYLKCWFWLKLNTSWSRAVPSSGQVWFVKVLSVSFQKTLKSRFGRQTQQHFQFCLNIFSCLVRIKLHTKNQHPSLLNSGYRYEEDLKIRIWKTTSTTFPVFSIFLLELFCSITPSIKNNVK